MFSSEPRVLALQISCLVLGVVVATGGGLLALLADPDRPVQAVPVFVVAGTIFCGGLALLCWFAPLVAYVAT
jgi:hypothetical protein